MVARATEDLKLGLIKTATASGTITQGQLVKGALSAAQNAGDGEDGFAIALESIASGKTGQVLLLTGGAIARVRVGTGGATLGKLATCTIGGGTDGFKDITPASGSTVRYVQGTFMDTGVAGDWVGLMIHKQTFVGT